MEQEIDIEAARLQLRRAHQQGTLRIGRAKAHEGGSRTVFRPAYEVLRAPGHRRLKLNKRGVDPVQPTAGPTQQSKQSYQRKDHQSRQATPKTLPMKAAIQRTTGCERGTALVLSVTHMGFVFIVEPRRVNANVHYVQSGRK